MSGKKRTTFAKLARESKLREKRQEKQARKDARKLAAELGPEQPLDDETMMGADLGEDEPELSDESAAETVTATQADSER